VHFYSPFFEQIIYVLPPICSSIEITISDGFADDVSASKRKAALLTKNPFAYATGFLKLE